MTSVFDPDAFMNQTVEGENDTKFEPIPEGEYPAVIDTIQFRSVDTKAGPRVVLDVMYELQDAAVKEQLGRDSLKVRQSIFIDTTPSGAIDLGRGKNVGLGKLRAAVNQNTPGWQPAMLQGAGPVLVKVGHRPDKNDPSVVFAEVKAVGKF